MMLLDGITCHESTKRKLEVYAANHGKHLVKPFMLVVCKGYRPRSVGGKFHQIR